MTELEGSSPPLSPSFPHPIPPQNQIFQTAPFERFDFSFQGSRGRRMRCDFHFRAAVGAEFHPQGWVSGSSVAF